MLPELATFFAAFIPFVDRVASLIGTHYELSAPTALFFASAGSITLTSILLIVIPPFFRFLQKKSQKMDHLLERIYKQTRKKHSKNFDRYGTLFLIIFVAVPIPGSGIIVGSILAFLFKIDYWKSLVYIGIGAFLTHFIVLSGVESFAAIYRLFE